LVLSDLAMVSGMIDLMLNNVWVKHNGGNV
jgi:hypothetical protein